MSPIRVLLAFLVLLLGNSPLRADGLLYQLPADGTWVQFDGEMIDSSGAARPIQIVLKSVGRVDDPEKPLRWIEIKAPSEDATQIVKLLIPEANLKEGEDPTSHVLRGWSRIAEQNPKALSGGRGFWQQILLAGPLHNVQQLEPELIEGRLGRLQCPGLTGEANVQEEEGYELALSYQVRRHPKAPFAVVAYEVKCRVSRQGKHHGESTIRLELSDYGTGAESELPGYL